MSPKVFHMARCVACGLDMPFGSHDEREKWIEGHREGHRISPLNQSPHVGIHQWLEVK